MARHTSARRPDMIRGSVVTHRRKCGKWGKRGCRCAGGDTLHEATVLSYSEAGRTQRAWMLVFSSAEMTKSLSVKSSPSHCRA